MTKGKQLLIGITAILLHVSSLPLVAEPRSPLPALPSAAMGLYHNRFDEAFWQDKERGETVQTEAGLLVQSWSGYALQRADKSVTPFVVPSLNERGWLNVACDFGSVGFWFKPYWSSSAVKSGSEPGVAARLLDMVVIGAKDAAVGWSLQVSADGNAIVLLGANGEAVLKSDIAWSAGEWHWVVLNYGTKGTALYVDDAWVAEGDVTLALSAKFAGLILGSSLLGDETAGGEFEDFYCYRKPMTGKQPSFGYEGNKKRTLQGPVSAEEVDALAKRRAERKALKDAEALLEPEGGGGGMMLRMAGPANECVTNGPVYLTNVVCSFNTNDGWTLMFDVSGGTNGVIYDLFSTPTLNSNNAWTWLETAQTCETHYFTNQPTNQTFYTILTPGADRDADGIYDGWEWKHFGNLNQTAAGDFDGDGIGNAAEYANNTDPNTIYFSVLAPNDLVSSSTASVQITMITGVADAMAVLVDNTNYTSAVWNNYDSSPAVNLGSTEGWHQVWVGLRGHMTDAPSVWRKTRIKLDTTPPLLVITNPTSITGFKPTIQVKGFSPEALVGLTYDLTNALGLVTNKQGFVIDQRFSTNTWEYTTNYFQCFDVPLANGTNKLTLRASDLVGNVTVTNLIFVLDYSGKTNPPVISLGWPRTGTRIGSDSFTARGWLDDPTAQVIAQIVGTNGVTNIVSGRVGRDGDFYIENLPLSPGTNYLTLIATDVANNSTSTNLSVIKSALSLTVSSVEIGYTASGTISDTNYAVWVGGVRADVYADGSWYADPRLTLDNSTAQVRAIPNADNGGNGLASAAAGDNPTSSQEVDAEQMLEWPGGLVYGSSMNSTYEWIEWQPSGFKTAGRWMFEWDEPEGGRDSAIAHINWGPTNTSETIWDPGRFPGVDGVTTEIGHQAEWPYYYYSNTFNVYAFPGGSGWYGYFGHLYFKLDNASGWDSETFDDNTELVLVTGGDPGSTEKQLYEISGGAATWWHGSISNGYNMISTNIPSEGRRIGQLGQLDANGKLYVTLPDRTQVSVQPELPSEGYHSIVLNAKLYSWVSQCVAPVPTNTTRLTLGVGEQVYLSWNPPFAVVTNYSVSGGGSLAPITGDNTVWRFTAPSNASTVTITFTLQKAVLTKTFTVIEPTGVDATIFSTTKTPPIGTNIAGAWMQMNVTIAPTTVSFYRVQMLEIGRDATSVTGYFTNHPPLSHINNGADQWHPVGYNNLIGDGMDVCSYWGNLMPQPWQQGNFTWPIPAVWRVGNGTTNSLPWSDQVFSLQSNGSFSVTKFGQTVTRSTNNVRTPNL